MASNAPHRKYSGLSLSVYNLQKKFKDVVHCVIVMFIFHCLLRTYCKGVFNKQKNKYLVSLIKNCTFLEQNILMLLESIFWTFLSLVGK